MFLLSVGPTGIVPELIAEALIPNHVTFPEIDWLIGNHSDELTPWIPYIASKCPNNRYLFSACVMCCMMCPTNVVVVYYAFFLDFLCTFFVLPCCFFDFEGRFTQHDEKLGRYHTYLQYIGMFYVM